MEPQQTAPPRRPSVLVRVEPQVLGDSLTVALEAEGLEVVHTVAVPAQGWAPQPVELAVVTELLADDIIADTVIELDPSGRSFVVTRKGQGGDLAVTDALGVLLALVERLVGRPVEG